LKKVKWSDSLSVGIESVDNDHKKLISIINRLLDNIHKDVDKDILLDIFHELEDYTVYHFNREEKLMHEICAHKDVDDPYKENHLKQHKVFKESVAKLKERFKNESTKESYYEITNFLTQWLLEHIISEDLTLSQCFVEHQKRVECKKKKKLFCKTLLEAFNNIFPLSLRVKLIVIIPFLTILAISSFFSYSIYKEYNRLTDIKEISKLFVCVNELTNSLQIERGLGVGVVSSGYKNFKKQYSDQTKISDKRAKKCLNSLTELKKYPQLKIDKLKSEFESIKKIRDDIRDK
jgi:hemerythrin